MIEEPNEISTSTLLKFIGSRKICVLRAKKGSALGFNNKIFLTLLEQEFQADVNCGWINISKINPANTKIQTLVKSWMNHLGLPFTESLPPGFYLFHNGIVAGYHPGTIDINNNADKNIHGIAALIGLLAGFIVGLIEKNTEKGFDAFFIAMEAPQAYKVFDFFVEILKGGNSSSSSQKKQSKVYDEGLQNAYDLLGVSPDSLDDEIKKAKKRMLLKYHPDKGDPNMSDAEREERNRISAEINNAYELIMKSRGRKK